MLFYNNVLLRVMAKRVRFIDIIFYYFFQSEAKMDKVELAFRKFDTNKDGFLSRDEFDQVCECIYSIFKNVLLVVLLSTFDAPIHMHIVAFLSYFMAF